MASNVKVWDVFVRMFHWSLAALVGVALLTGDEFLTAHAFAGYIILFLLAGRTLWGVVGPQYARFSDFLYSPAKIISFIKDMALLRHKRYLGHNPAAGIMVVTLMAFASLTVITGAVTYGMKEAAGPLFHLAASGWKYGDLFEEIHGFFAWGTVSLAGIHVLAVLLESLYYGENLVAGMITGLKKRTV